MKTHQRGATALEFTFVFIIFTMFLMGIVDFSRMVYTWAAANEATRLGARYAVVCHDGTDVYDEAVRTMMRAVLPQIDTVSVEWTPPSCGISNCEGVTVSITNMNFQWITPVLGTIVRPSIAMPGFGTYLPREVMRQDPRSTDTLCSPTSTP